MLELAGLHKRFGDVIALDGCSFTAAPGQMLGFLGPNGAGKTTAMRAVFGLVRPDRGAVTWEGARVTAEIRRSFGYMPEERGLYPKMRVWDQLRYLGRLHGMAREAAEEATDRWLEVFGLTERRDAKIETLSHGNQQRVQLIAALVHEPPVLILDEPFIGLDPMAAHTMASILRSRADAGAVVVFSSHQLDVVEDLCEDVVVIDRGRVILAGKVNRLRSSSPRRYLDVVFDGPFDRQWTDRMASVSPVAKRDDGGRWLVEDDADLGGLVSAASAAGTVAQFSLEPPPLSEVFREVVAP